MTFAAVREGVRWLSAEFMATREQAQRHLGPMLAEGLVARGYAHQAGDGRLAVSDTGRRMLAATERPEADDAD